LKQRLTWFSPLPDELPKRERRSPTRLSIAPWLRVVSPDIGFSDCVNRVRFASIENAAHQSSTALHLLLFVRISVQM
jgi:hypothetical protein